MNIDTIDTIKTVAKGVVGVGTTQATDLLPSSTNWNEVIKCAVQVLIGIATILSLFIKKKNK